MIKKIFKWILIVFGVLFLIGLIGTIVSPKTGTTTSSTTGTASTSTTETATAEPIEYEAVTVDQMMNDLENNALNAKETYNGKYLEVTGRLGVIDASGKYISLYPMDNEYAITGVQCYIKNDDQRSRVAQMNSDDTVTLRGKCKDVGELLGYQLDIDSID